MSTVEVSLCEEEAMGCDVEGSSSSPEDPMSNYLYWSNHAQDVGDTLTLLQQTESMVDVTMRAGGKSIQVHRMVLCASSPFLQDLLQDVNDPNPTIILPDVEIHELKIIVEFIYKGEIGFKVDQLPSLIKIADLLGIHGLTEISCQLPQMDEGDLEDESMGLSLWESSDGNAEDEPGGNTEEVVSGGAARTVHHKQLLVPKTALKRPSRAIKEKKYNEETMEKALEQMRLGRSLCDVAQAFSIPRTTLYLRARSMGVISTSNRVGYTQEQMESAIAAVREGSSLQTASSQFRIPKSVLWRRTQGMRPPAPKIIPSYSEDDKLAAIQALQRGEQLQTVAREFAIPKTTLFRAKARLVAKGALPRDSIKRRCGEGMDSERCERVEQAVEACKQGKMSQSAASLHYKIPKTTIWRRLQSDARQKCTDGSGGAGSTKQELEEDVEEEEVEQVHEEIVTVSLGAASTMQFVSTEEDEFGTPELIVLSAVGEVEEQVELETALVEEHVDQEMSECQDESQNK